MGVLNKKRRRKILLQKVHVVYYIKCQGLSSFFIKPISGSNKKYVKISGTMAVISGNIKLINNSFILKYLNINYAPFLFYN